MCILSTNKIRFPYGFSNHPSCSLSLSPPSPSAPASSSTPAKAPPPGLHGPLQSISVFLSLSLEKPVEIHVEDSQKLKVDLPYDPATPLLGTRPKDSTPHSTDTGSGIFITAVLTNPGNGNNPSVLR